MSDDRLTKIEENVADVAEAVAELLDRVTALTMVNNGAFAALAQAGLLDLDLIRQKARSTLTSEMADAERRQRLSVYIEEIIGRARQAANLTVIEGGKRDDDSP
jgi:hypothetical protein